MAAVLIAPAAAQAAPKVECSRGIENVVRCTALDRRMARKLAVKVFSRIDADWNTGSARSVFCQTPRAPRVWSCTVQFEDGNGNPLYANATIRRGGGVRVTAVFS